METNNKVNVDGKIVLKATNTRKHTLFITLIRGFYPHNTIPSNISNIRFSILLPRWQHLNRSRLCSTSIPTLNSAK